ncbi:glycosyltransferase family 2 protein [Paenibacillus thermotolerans]|uniref:glycosyltransferase family 2 protein n=1 Tax=Paenibacillus thermotolerans TaxID=3027807 RepID=UPI002368DDEF|nr:MULTISPECIES: glycosyltransferase family 2 protein [unclassified Paenibacillus]
MTRIVVFLPAYNEAESIGGVIRRVPRVLPGFPNAVVEIVVVDDGSTDATASAAAEAGADRVLRQPRNRGLGAAVRAGLAESLRLGADVGVMIDADNEYPPESIPAVVEPILRGEADYVFGSRFLGTIKGMKLHRRLGNYAFTWLQRILLAVSPGYGARFVRLTDGQSGMRAFSREAMERADIIHDYNYAQVITLNLLRQGFRHKDMPIAYQVRTKGRSFIKLRKYAMAVLPAIALEMRRKPRKRAGLS